MEMLAPYRAYRGATPKLYDPANPLSLTVGCFTGLVLGGIRAPCVEEWCEDAGVEMAVEELCDEVSTWEDVWGYKLTFKSIPDLLAFRMRWI